jgi:hypothetical protein
MVGHRKIIYMAVKNLLGKKLSFFDGNVKFDSINLSQTTAAWKIFIEVEVSQKTKSAFKIKANINDSADTEIGSDVFDFDDTDAKRILIFGNPFEKDATIISKVSFEYFDYTPNSLVYFWIYIYEVDEGSREDLFPFSKTG